MHQDKGIDRRSFMGLATAIGVSVAFPTSFALADVSYSDLDGMSKQELENLRNEIDSRLNSLSDSESSLNDVSSSKGVKSTSSIWKIEEVKDRFDRPTGAYQMYTIDPIEGTFSNSATTDSPCLFEPLIEQDSNDIFSFSLIILEYKSDLVKASYDDIAYSIDILDNDSNEEHVYTGVMAEGTAKITIDDDYSQRVDSYLSAEDYASHHSTGEYRNAVDFITSGKSLSFIVDNISKYGTESYFFKIEDNSGADELYEELTIK